MTVVETATRLRAARAIEKAESQASEQALKVLRRRGHRNHPPALVSDGGSGCAEALLSVYGRVPSYAGRGRRPSRPREVAGWRHLRAVKRRDEKGRYQGTDFRVVFGQPGEVMAVLGGGTSLVERTHLTMRQFNARLARKGLGFSKDLAMYRRAAAWEDAVYNLVRPVKTLRVAIASGSARRWSPRTPMMAAGITDHPWTLRELLTAVPVFNCNSK